MSALPWYKCYPRDFNDGMLGLTLEERGAYVTILNAIYARGGPMPDEPGYVAALLTCSPRTWLKVRAALIVKGKLEEVETAGRLGLMNPRAAAELDERAAQAEELSRRGSRGGKKRVENQALKFNEIRHLAQAPACASLEPGSTDTDTEADRDKNSPEHIEVPSEPSVAGAVAPPAKKEPRGSRISPDWKPNADETNYALREGLSLEEIDREADKFRDYYLAKAGADARRVDWYASWRTWVRNARDRRGAGLAGRQGPGGGGQRATSLADLAARRRGYT